MASSIVEICNAALLDLGQDAIMSLTDDDRGASLCNNRWPGVRDAVMRAHPWACCLAQAELAAAVASPLWKWDYQYALPADFLRLVEVVGGDDAAVNEWEIQAGAILCNEAAPIRIAYVRRETDPARYDALLGETLAARLAATIAYPLTGSTSLAQTFWELYQKKLAEARGVDAREGGDQRRVGYAPSTWLAAKKGA